MARPRGKSNHGISNNRSNPQYRLGKIQIALTLLATTSIIANCTLEQKIVAGTISAAVIGSALVSHEVEQTYYLGVFDPRDQLPPTLYRVRVHGQSSFINRTRFASGWVRAELVDSLGTEISFNDKSGRVEIKKANEDDKFNTLATGRRLMMFGPEGFREAPRDHRLVVVMGGNPEAFFNAVDQSLGSISEVIDEQRTVELERLLLRAQSQSRSELERLTDLKQDLLANPLKEGAK